jgi:hypothetical protein
MKSGVQMNFLERRASADRALSQLVHMVRDATETLSSREQGGVYRLESMLVEKSSVALPAAHVWIGSTLMARWLAFSTTMFVLVRNHFARGRVGTRSALARARAAWGSALARISIALRVRFGDARQWLRSMSRRAHGHWSVLASRRKAG